MRAWYVGRHGGNEVLERRDRPTPAPGPLEVRVRVEAIGLNRLDLWVRDGVPGHRFPLPLVPGSDAAGVIDAGEGAFGPGAEAALATQAPDGGLRAGSPVIVSPGVSCGRCAACLGGFDPICPQYRISGENRDGAAAEFIVVPIQNLIPRPASLTAAQAAAIPIPFLTAWTMLVRKARIRAGDIVLIHAGGSGVSVAAIQIAKLHGATVLTTVGADEKIAPARALGADHVINYRARPFREEVKRVLQDLGRKGCDIVVDHVGRDTLNESIRCLAWGGQLAICGATSGADVTIDLKQVFFKNLSLLGATMGSKADLRAIVDLAGRGQLTPIIDSTFAFAELPRAYDRIASRDAYGKVVVTGPA